MVVVLGERNEGMKGMNSPVTGHNSRVFRFGNKGSLMVQSCRTGSTSGSSMPREPHSASFRILRACFWRRVHSVVVLGLSGVCQIKWLKGWNARVVGVLTMHLPSSKTSLGKNPSRGSNSSCLSHNAPNAGSSKLLQQHANATAAACCLCATSSWATSLTISSTWRQGCIEIRRYVGRVSETRRNFKPTAPAEVFGTWSPGSIVTCTGGVVERWGVEQVRRWVNGTPLSHCYVPYG